LEKRWLSLGTAAIKKIISMAAWWSIIFFIACGVGYLTLMCFIGFFSEHTEGISRAKKYYKATLCYLASDSFFWHGFLFCAVGAALLFFFSVFQKK
jgi:hypothetical protein